MQRIGNNAELFPVWHSCRNRGGEVELDTADVIAEETRPLKEEIESRKSYLNMSAREA